MSDFAEDRNDLPEISDEAFASGFGAACDESGSFLKMDLRNVNKVFNIITKRITIAASGVSGFTNRINANQAAASTNKDDISGLRSTVLAQSSSLVVKGTIVMWAGTQVPSGWAFCDGQNGTPDLRGKFPIGFTSSGNFVRPLNTTGGSFDVDVTAAGTHNHGGNTGGTTLSIAQIPSHGHTTTQTPHNHQHQDGVENAATYRVDDGNDTFVPTAKTILTRTTGNSNIDITVNNTGGGTAHNHTVPNDGNHTHNAVSVPPYYAIGFIQKL